YNYLVKNESKFWNISGLKANISAQGVDVSLDSMISFIAGGITFSSPDSDQPLDSNNLFELYDSIADSQVGLAIELITDNIKNLPKGAGILFKGHDIGRITDLQYSKEDQHFVASALINPQFEELITEGSQFWLEQTSVSFSEVKNIGNIIKGDYIAFRPAADSQSEGSKKATRFIIQQSAPPESPVLALLILSEDASGLSKDAPITYQGIKIGKIDSVDLAENSDFIEIHTAIDQQYQYLINKDSQFYLLSGVNFKASLKGLEVQSAPVENILSGGIGLYNKNSVTKTAKTAPLDKGQRFRLYPSKELAKVGQNVFSQSTFISLLSKELPAVSEGSPVYYRKLPIGEVSSFSIHSSGLMETTLSIKGQYKHLIKSDSVFWNISGFNVDAGLSGIKIEADSLMSIAVGGIAVGPGSKDIDNKYNNGKYKLFASQTEATIPTSTIKLTFDHADDLQAGSLLRLKGLVVGEVMDLSLTTDGKVRANVNLKPEFSAQIARQGSRFWMVTSDISLSGAKNLSTLVTGAYINVTPGKGANQTYFSGEDSAPILAPEQSGLPIVLLADNAGSTDISSPVYHRQIQIGEVIAKQLS
ncbi:MAG: MlaD family protein, partial [Psychromonas sp.]